MKEVLAVIPARLDSKRLPKKVLIEINGKTIIQHVVEKCLKIFDSRKVIVLSDKEEVIENLKEYPIKTFLTSEKCQSGSERISSALEDILNYSKTTLEETGIINIQADQPTVNTKTIKKIYSLLSNDKDVNVITPIYKLTKDNLQNSNIVKVIRRSDDIAIYFSRSVIPFCRDYPLSEWTNECEYWGHVGIYGYRASILKKWNSLPKSLLESVEKLEQLRLIEAGIEIKTIEADNDCISIDTSDDLERVRSILNH